MTSYCWHSPPIPPGILSERRSVQSIVTGTVPGVFGDTVALMVGYQNSTGDSVNGGLLWLQFPAGATPSTQPTIVPQQLAVALGNGFYYQTSAFGAGFAMQALPGTTPPAILIQNFTAYGTSYQAATWTVGSTSGEGV